MERSDIHDSYSNDDAISASVNDDDDIDESSRQSKSSHPTSSDNNNNRHDGVRNSLKMKRNMSVVYDMH
jgi:hypothetical protein